MRASFALVALYAAVAAFAAPASDYAADLPDVSAPKPCDTDGDAGNKPLTLPVPTPIAVQSDYPEASPADKTVMPKPRVAAPVPAAESAYPTRPSTGSFPKTTMPTVKAPSSPRPTRKPDTDATRRPARVSSPKYAESEPSTTTLPDDIRPIVIVINKCSCNDDDDEGMLDVNPLAGYSPLPTAESDCGDDDDETLADILPSPRRRPARPSLNRESDYAPRTPAARPSLNRESDYTPQTPAARPSLNRESDYTSRASMPRRSGRLAPATDDEDEEPTRRRAMAQPSRRRFPTPLARDDSKTHHAAILPTTRPRPLEQRKSALPRQANRTHTLRWNSTSVGAKNASTTAEHDKVNEATAPVKVA